MLNVSEHSLTPPETRKAVRFLNSEPAHATFHDLPTDLQRRIVLEAVEEIPEHVTNKTFLTPAWSNFHALRETSKDINRFVSDKIESLSLYESVGKKQESFKPETLAKLVNAYPRIEGISLGSGTVSSTHLDNLSGASNLKSIVFRFPKEFPATAFESLTRLPHLRRIAFCGVSGITDTTLTKLTILQKLEDLTLIGDNSVTLKSIAKFKGLRKLAFKLSSADETNPHPGIEALAALKDLHNLVLKSSREFQDVDVVSLPKYSVLEELTLTPGHALTARGMRSIAAIPNLKVIEAGYVDERRLAVLAKNQHLEMIVAYDTNDHPNTIENAHLGHLKDHPKFRAMCLSGNQRLQKDGLLQRFLEIPRFNEVQLTPNDDLSPEDIEEVQSQLQSR